MMTKIYIISIVSQVIRFVFILLFTYVAVSKLLEFEEFSVGLSQTPLVKEGANWVAMGIPAASLLSVGLLVYKRSILLGLYGVFALMLSFTTYTAWALTFSPSLPCTCNGLFDLAWKEHLLFNTIFLGLVVAGIILEKKVGTVKFD